MKGTLKKSIIFVCIFSLIFVFSSSILASEAESEIKHISVPDYFDKGELQILFPNGKLLCIGTDYVGHGDIFSPFKGLSINIKDGARKKKSNFKRKILIRLLLPIFIEQSDITKSVFTWSLDSKLNPLKEFIFKLFLLVNSYSAQDDYKVMFEEIFLLLFRFTQSRFDLININESLSSYFPQEIKEIFENLKMTFLIDFIDNTWSFINNPNDLDILSHNNKVQVLGLIFNNQELAEKCHRKLSKNCNKQEFKNNLLQDDVRGKRLIIDSNYNVFDYQDYLNFSDDDSIGLIDLSLDLEKEDNDIPKKIKKIINEKIEETADSSFSDTLMIPIEEDNKFWLVHVTNKMDLNDSILALFKSLLKVFRSYLKVSNNTNEKNNTIKNRALVQQERNKLENYKQRLEVQLNLINQEIIRKQEDIKIFNSDDEDNVFIDIENNKLERLREKKKKIEKIINETEEELKEVLSIKINRNFNIEEIIKNLNSDISPFKKIRNDFIKNLELILINSDSNYLQNNWDILKAILEDIFPALKSDLEQIKINRNQINWLEALLG